MGLGGEAIEAIGREHAYRPITGDVVFIGRQTTYFTADELAAMLRGYGHRVDAAAMEIDRSTTNRQQGHEGKELVTDRSIFLALGIASIRALDVSDYEGAEIVHDLNEPLPPHLHGCADFVVDGSTLDNVFDPATCLRNMAALLRPGGRLLTINAYTTQQTAYTLCSPPWYFDYFVENGFADCRVYVIVARRSRKNAFWLDPAYIDRARGGTLGFSARGNVFIVALAERGATSTIDKSPVQQPYRAAANWVEYAERLRPVLASQRPHLARSSGDLFIANPTAGYVWVDGNFTARRHWRQIPHRAYSKVRRTIRALRAQPARSSSKP
jgi:SAM-dependent methyltransferase